MPGSAPVVLVVDDEQLVLSVIERMLQRAGYRTLTAADGVQALETCRTADEVDLVLTDINMPRMDGVELADCLREHKRRCRLSS